MYTPVETRAIRFTANRVWSLDAGSMSVPASPRPSHVSTHIPVRDSRGAAVTTVEGPFSRTNQRKNAVRRTIRGRTSRLYGSRQMSVNLLQQIGVSQFVSLGFKLRAYRLPPDESSQRAAIGNSESRVEMASGIPLAVHTPIRYSRLDGRPAQRSSEP